MYRSLLVPLDGSPFGEHALPLVRAIARQTGAALHLVHAHVVTVPISADAILVFDQAWDAQDRARRDHAGIAVSATQGGAGGIANSAGLAAHGRVSAYVNPP